MQQSRIYLSPPHLGDDELENVKAAFASKWIAPLGPQVDAFEEDICQYLDCRAATALSSGTAAIHLALLILGVGPGDGVICPTLTFAASANPIIYVGATPIFIDSEPHSWNIDPHLLNLELRERAAAGKLPKAAIIVDLYGQCANYLDIARICEEFGVPIIEDAAEALGASYEGRMAGTLGSLGVFSFNGNKIITTSGGGMLVSQDRNLINEARFLACQAKDPAPHYQHSKIGYNYRMSNVLAAIGRGQLKILPQRIAARRQVRQAYQNALGDLDGLSFLPLRDAASANHWLTCITIDENQFGANREQIRLALEEANIESRPVWKPLHMQPCFAQYKMRGGDVAEALFDAGLCLPSGSAMTPTDIERVCKVIKRQFAVNRF